MSIATVVSWGTQSRARCPHCKVMIGTGRSVSCKRCGRRYKALADGTYQEINPDERRT